MKTRTTKPSPSAIWFRDYQARLLRDLTIYLGQSDEVVLSAPTGAGKTLILQGLVTHVVNHRDLVANSSRCAVVAVPQLQIEDAFSVDEDQEVFFESEEADTISPCPITIRTTDWIKGRDRDHEGKTRKKFFDHLRTPRVKGMITTHQALSLWFSEHLRDWPANLEDRLLIIDEAHLAGHDNKLGQVAKLWVKRGGKVLYATATPWRADGRLVAPDNGRWAVLTLAEHLQGGFAPEKLEVRTHLTSLQADTAAQVAGDRLGRGDVEESCADIVRLWIDDGCPKAVINVPLDAKSEEWARVLEETFRSLEDPPRVHNAVGTGLEVSTALQAVLKTEREVGRFQDSQVDIFIACRRFELGTDWKLCSHVYNIGLTSSFSRILQMLGRALRDKKKIKGYPQEHLNLARFTFLIAQTSMEVWTDYFLRHTDHSYLLAIFMQDRETGQTLLREVSRELGGHGPRPGSRETRIAYREVVRSLLNLLRMDESETRHVAKDIVRAELELEQKGVVPTQGAVLKHLTARGTDQKILGAVRRFYGHQGSARFKAAVARGMKALADGCPARIIRRDLQKVFDTALEDFEDDLSIIHQGAFQYLAELSGHRAIEIADLMRERLGHYQSLSFSIIDAAICAYAKDHGGKAPNAKSGDATTYFGHARTWVSVDYQLRGRGSSLSKRAIEIGVAAHSHGYKITDEKINSAIIAYAKDHEQYGPSARSGDATKYFAHRRTWMSIALKLRSRGSSLVKRSMELGVKVQTQNYSITDQFINESIRKYASDHGGKAPTTGSGDATPYFNHQRTWISVNDLLRRRGSNLPKRTYELGIEVLSQNHMLTDKIINKAICAYAKDHDGIAPNATSGDATHYFGYPRTWASVCLRLVGQGSSLPKRAIDLGVKVDPHNYVLADEDINKAIYAYAKNHKGRAPNAKSGDATNYFGHRRTWVSVDDHLRSRNSSLPKRAVDLGMEVCSRNYGVTDEIINEAIRAYTKDHEGRTPNAKSDHATKYFGHRRTWGSIDQRLIKQGSSLAKYAKQILAKFSAHDFSDCPKKHATREETLRIVREKSPFWQGGRLACDWLELAGGPDQTVKMLEGALGERGRYLGISNDPQVVEMNRRLYGDLEHVEWVEDDVLTAIGAADKRARYERVGVFVYDTERSLASHNFIRDLQYVLEFAKEQYRRMGAFVLVLNFVQRGKDLKKNIRAYEQEILKLTKQRVNFETYRNKNPGVTMLLARVGWGFSP